MGRKVYVEITVMAVVEMDKDIKVSDVVNEMDYSFSSNTKGAHISKTEIRDHRIVRIET